MLKKIIVCFLNCNFIFLNKLTSNKLQNDSENLGRSIFSLNRRLLTAKPTREDTFFFNIK